MVLVTNIWLSLWQPFAKQGCVAGAPPDGLVAQHRADIRVRRRPRCGQGLWRRWQQSSLRAGSSPLPGPLVACLRAAILLLSPDVPSWTSPPVLPCLQLRGLLKKLAPDLSPLCLSLFPFKTFCAIPLFFAEMQPCPNIEDPS